MATPLRDVLTYTGAQTDAIVRAVAANVGLRVNFLEITVSKACTVNVDALVEFDDATDVPIQKWNAIPPGSGIAFWIGTNGLDGQDVLFTCTAPTSGDVTVKMTSMQFATV